MKITLIFTIFLFVNLKNSEGGNQKCEKRNLELAKLVGRPCRRSCYSNSNSRQIRGCSSKQTCVCDYECGYSCVNLEGKCPPPPSIPNTQEVVVRRRTSNGSLIPVSASRRYKYNDEAEYVCKPGYRRESQVVRHFCHSRHRWTGNVECVLIECKVPILQHGFATSKSKYTRDGYMVYGAKLTYSCNPGYEMVDVTSGSVTVTCRKSGEWSQPIPSCVEKYYCNGQCNVTRKHCNCTDTCIDDMSCCSDYKATCLNESAWEEDECASESEMRCPADFDVPPVILFSFDGFRTEYIYRNLTPNIWKLAKCGVHTPYMRAVYPTKTFPTHYSIVTGLYPESHGIIDNKMVDHDLQEVFRPGRKTSFDPAWWGGEPIWVSTSNQGKISATYFWPGSDVNITRYPDYYEKFDGSVPCEERVYQGLKWLDLPKEKRPSFITLYSELVDTAGHVHGPVSPGLDDSLVEADKYVGLLMDGLKLRNLQNCVNIILLADHGMASTSCDRKTNIEEYGVDVSAVFTRLGGAGRIGKSKDSSQWPLFNADTVYNQLKCTRQDSHWQVFLKNDHPKRFHYANNDRIEPILLVVDDEWLVEGAKDSNHECNGGTHAYDNMYENMHALFSAHGPGFKRAYNTTRPFESIELYNLMADLLEITPAPNNGTPGALYNIMSAPKQKGLEPHGLDPATCPYTPGLTGNDAVQECAFCSEKNIGAADARLRAVDILAAEDFNLLFGRPSIFAVDQDPTRFCLLYQNDYVTAFEFTRKMPRYASYTLTHDKVRDLTKPSGCSRPDKTRVNVADQIPCSVYTTNITQAFLYPPELSNGDAVHDALINTNSVPMYTPAVQVWNYLSLVFGDWATSYGGINVISGPVFDYNYDGLADSEDILLKNGSFLAPGASIPTHFFLVITRCRNPTGGNVISSCNTSPDDVEVLSFIIPNYQEEPCHSSTQASSDWIPRTLLQHIARVRDVELITGISFFPTWTRDPQSTQEERLGALSEKLHLPQFTSQWLEDFQNNPPNLAS